MQSVWERERLYRRRLAASLALAILAHLGLVLLAVRGSRPGDGPGLGGPEPAGAASRGTGALDWVDVRLGPPAAVEAAAAADPPPAEPVPEPEPEPEPVVSSAEDPLRIADPGSAGEAAPARLPGGDAAAAGEGGGTTGEGSPGSGGAETGSGAEAGRSPDAPQVLRARVLVHPYVPRKVLAKRKIDDYVRLQPLVGADGRVVDVSVLRKIADCEECTRSAIEALQQFVYDPPLVPAGMSGVWIEPIEMRFSWR